MAETSPASTKQEEWRTFLFLAVVTAPVLAVMEEEIDREDDPPRLH